MNRVYLDFNATTPVEPAVLDAMLPYFSADFGNAASIHTVGQRARAAVETARDQVATLLGARSQEIVFTSGGTESDNHAIFGIIRSTPGATKHIITTNIEHEAVLNTCQALEKDGIAVTYLPVNSDGVITVDQVEESLRPHTALITVMHANNELGSVQPLAQIGKLALQRDIYFHTDAVQSAGKIPLDVKTLGVDLLSISAHKLYGPKGIGALYIRGGSRLQQLLYGGHHQRGFRPGTENVPGIVGLGAAAAILTHERDTDAHRIRDLRDRLLTQLQDMIPGLKVNGSLSRRLPGNLSITLPGTDADQLIERLPSLAISTGSACNTGQAEPSHVLTAIGLTRTEARATLRIGLGRPTTEDEINTAMHALSGALHDDALINDPLAL